MGQTHTKANYDNASFPFLNLSPMALETVRAALFQASPTRVSYGLDKDELHDILYLLMSDLNLDPHTESDRKIMRDLSNNFFRILDTDANKIIDGLELLGILCVTSAILKIEDRYNFIFGCYDFHKERALTEDQVSFALQNLTLGLNKLVCPDKEGKDAVECTPEFFISSIEIKRHVENMLLLHSELTLAADELDCSSISACPWTMISFDVIIPYCVEEFSGWMEYFGEPNEPFIYGDDNSNTSKVEGRKLAKLNHCDASEVDQDSVISSPLTPADLNPVTALNTAESNNLSFPPPQLKLEWVNGYSKGRVAYNQNDEVIYFATSVGVVAAKNSEQRHFLEHTAEIGAMAMHPDGVLAATADNLQHSEIIVWDTISIEKKNCFLTKCSRKGVSHLSFNDDGRLLASMGGQSGSYLCVHNWETGSLVFSTSTETKVCDLTFGKDDLIVTCGYKFLHFWNKSLVCTKPTIESENTVYRRAVGVFGNKEWYNQAHSCLTNYKEKIISGSSKGQVFIWTSRKCARVANAHEGSVDAIEASDNFFATGGSDKKVILWTSALHKKAAYDLTLLSLAPLVTSLCFSKNKSTIVVGMQSGIQEISALNGSETQDNSIATCHFGSALNGVAVHPLKGEYCTGGQDGFLRLWDPSSNKMLRSVFLESPIQCVAYDPSGNFLCIGFSSLSSSRLLNFHHRNKEGAFAIVSHNGLDVKHEARDSRESILVATFSPDGETLALGSKDQSIYIYNSDSEYSLLSVTTGNYGPVRSIDFSEEGDWIQANTSLDNAFFVSLENYSIVKEEDFSNLREISWFTQTCPVGWSTVGIWPQPSTGVKVSSICRNEGESLLAVGYSNGNVSLVHFPGTFVHPETKITSGHSSPVTNICFANEDTSIISIGQTDCCVLHWKLNDEKSNQTLSPSTKKYEVDG